QFKKHKPQNVILVAFNGEEYGFLVSKEFVNEHSSKIKQAIIFEMVGYYSKEPGSQTMPIGFPPIDVGDFLAIVGNRDSKNLGKN
ncbi:M28 family peptidase, partial [Erwinia amylovora]|uniref:M28 family peptidase n=1 Tax=Erwinia amylovora TaxID=552 RepID=UPI0020BEB315